MPALAVLVAEEMASYPDPAVVRSVFGLTDASSVAALVQEWVATHLEQPVSDVWLWAVSVACVAGLTLRDGTDVVVKIYPPDRNVDLLAAMHDAQRAALRHGLPAPEPVVGPTPIGPTLATADTALRVGRHPNLRRADDRQQVAEGLARFIRAMAQVTAELAARLPPPGAQVCGLYPAPHSPLFDFEATATGAEWIDRLAHRARAGMDALDASPTVVHLDWRADNVRLAPGHGEVVAIYDWDAVRVEREAVAVGQVAGMHSVDWSAPGRPYFATGPECLAFAADVEHGRERPFTAEEWRAVRAAVVFQWCYTARCEHARAAVGDDKPEFGMRSRLASDGEAVLARSF